MSKGAEGGICWRCRFENTYRLDDTPETLKCGHCRKCGHGKPGHGGRRCIAWINTAACGPMGPPEPDQCGCQGSAKIHFREEQQ